MIGKTISHYKILEKLGEGGMGVVYKAQDTELEREVAIKFLPHHIAVNADERARFKVEAKAAASLNHNNIATIHNIEEVDDEIFIVMEYIDGKELGDLVEARGPLSLHEVLEYSVQIAKGLQTAHEKGIVHRDIKSANIMLTEKGDVKIMDFGLAKVRGGPKLTKEQSTLGTASYMSPEQTRGEQVDHRSDIFSFGVLLFEMLSGQLPFMGDYDQAVIYSIINEEPESLTGLRSGIPTELEQIVNKCLEKDASVRYPSANDLIVDLSKLKRESETKEYISKSTEVTSKPKSERPKYVVPATIFVTIIILILGYIIIGPKPGNNIPRLINPRQLTSGIGVETNVTWSPDSKLLAYRAWSGGFNFDIWILQLGVGQPVNRTKDFNGFDDNPSWSPDGTRIAFFSSRDGGGYYIMPAVGGRPRLLQSGGSSLRQVFWSNDGSSISIARHINSDNVMELTSLESGESQNIPMPGKYSERLDISASSDGRFFAYVDANGDNAEVTRIWTVRVSDSLAFPMTEGSFNARSPTWSQDSKTLYFVSNRGGSSDLWQLPISKEGKPDGVPVPLTAGIGMQQAVFSPDGRKLAYSKGRSVANIWRIKIPKEGDASAKWGDAEQITFDNALIEFMNISPDRKLLAFSSDRSGNQDIWTIPIEGGEPHQLTTDPTPDWHPSWSPDGQQIVFYAFRSGNRDIWVMPASGGNARQLTDHEKVDYLPFWTPDGKRINFISERNGDRDIWQVDADGSDLTPLTSGSNLDYDPTWSPDGSKLGFYSTRDPDYRLGIWYLPADGGDAERLIRSDVTFTGRYFCWSPNGDKVYVKVIDQGKPSLIAISIADGSIRHLADLSGRYGSFGAGYLETDGEYLYFNWYQPTGDIWMMDVEVDE